MLSEISDNMGEQCIGISFSDFPIRSLGFPQAPDWPQSVQSNTPDGVALRSLRSLIPAHPRRKYEAHPRLSGLRR